MSEFESLTVFISIIFGISLTHVLAGAVPTVYGRTVERDLFVWTL